MMKYLLSNLEDILSWEIDSVVGRIRLDYTRLHLVILRFCRFFWSQADRNGIRYMSCVGSALDLDSNQGG